MGTSPSLTSAGLTVLTEDQIVENIVEALQGSSMWGDKVSYGPDSPFGQLIRTFAGQLVEVYDLQQAQHQAFDPREAGGVQQDNLCEIVGVRRTAATYTTGTVTLGGTPATVIAAGKRARVGSDGPMVALDAAATIGGGGTVDADATAVDAGAVEINSTAVDTIVDAVAGWSSVTNAADFTTGEPIESDPILESRRARSFSISGSGTYYAIRARLEALDEVTAAAVLVNVTDTVDANGLPPKSFEPVVWPTGISPAIIAAAIMEVCGPPAGIEIHGDELYYVTDSKGFQQEIRYSEATELEMYVEFTLVTTSAYPTNGDDLVTAAAVAAGNALTLGDDVLIAACLEAAATGACPGISTIATRIKVGAGGAWQATSLTVGAAEIARFSTGRVTVL
jgi:hypothetical protein